MTYAGSTTSYGYDIDGLLTGTSDFTITTIGDLPRSVITLTNVDCTSASQNYRPRESSCGATGTSNSDYTLMIPVVGDIKIVLAQGGATVTGIVRVSGL